MLELQIEPKETYNFEEVLKYLNNWRSNRDIKERFNLTVNGWYRLNKFMVKGGFVKCATSHEIGLDCNNRITFYKIKN
jgi:hypothetical protein